MSHQSAETGFSGQGCGAGLFAKLLRSKPVVLELARADLDVEAGQMLTLAISESGYVKMVFASYGWPLLAALAGALAGHGLGTWLGFGKGPVDGITLLGGILAAWLSIRLTRRLGIAHIFMNSMNISICFPSTTPNICTGKVQKQSTINTF